MPNPHRIETTASGRYSYHVGQIVYIAKSLRGKDWKYLSIPPGQSEAVNKMLEARYGVSGS